MPPQRLRAAFSRMDIIKKDQDYLIPALLGFPLNGSQAVEVPGRLGYVYVRIRSNLNEVAQVFNDKVSAVYDLPVLLIRDPNNPTRYKIEGRDLNRYMDWGSPSAYIPRHASSHSFSPTQSLGGDVVWVYSQQIVPWNVAPSGSYGGPGVFINGHSTFTNGEWSYWGGTGTSSFVASIPSGSFARMILVSLDTNGNPITTIGDPFAITATGTSYLLSHIPDLPTDNIPLAAVYLPSGTSTIQWENIHDLRPFFTGQGGGVAPSSSTGTSSVDSIRLWDVSASQTKLYPANNAGLDAAFATMQQYDTLWIPPGLYNGNYGIPNYSTVIGTTQYGGQAGIERGSCEISARVTGTAVFVTGTEVTIQNLSIFAYSDAYPLPAIGIADSGTSYLQDMKIYARHTISSGTSYAIVGVGAGGTTIQGGEFRARKASGYHYPFDNVPRGFYVVHPPSSVKTLYANRFQVGASGSYSFFDSNGMLSSAGLGGVSVSYSSIFVSDPPTASELDSIFNAPGNLPNGFIGVVNSSGTSSRSYMVLSDGTSWWHQLFTKAI